MKTRICGVLAGVVVLSLLAVTVTACGGGKKAMAGAAVVTTLAGKAGSAGSADGSGAAARFLRPIGIARNAAGNLYVADTYNYTIRKITSAGEVTTVAGKADSKGSADGSGTTARFNEPIGIACDTEGNLYVTDYGKIRKITPAGVVTTLSSTGGWGIACDAAGNLYVTAGYMIRKISPAGKVTTLAGNARASGYADGSGAAARFDQAAGIACDTAGNLYVADTFGDTIRKITPAGVVTTLVGKNGSSGSVDGSGAAARFLHPIGIACDAAGNLYVTDDATIRKITPTGEVTTLAGKARSYGSADGSGAAARFSALEGVACDAAGNLYVLDYGNCTIRKITLSH